MARTKRKPAHYVNNAQFSQAVYDYCVEMRAAREADQQLPVVPNYIAECFLKIAEGLSLKDNFIRYSYREEMVMDAVENCLKAIENFNIDADTRTGLPNAFAYFTQISWYAFLRRIQKEKKQQDIKERYLSQSGLEEYVNSGVDDFETQKAIQSFVDQLKGRIDKIKEKDDEIKTFARDEKARQKRATIVDSDLQDFMNE